MNSDGIRVVQVLSGDLWAGAEAQLFQLIKELRGCREIELSVVLFNHGLLERRLLAESVRVTVLDERALSSLRIFLRLVALLRCIKPSVVHTHEQKANIIGSIAATIVRAQTVRTVHGAPESQVQAWDLRRHMLRIVDRFCARYVQRWTVVVTHHLAKLYDRQISHHLRVIPNGIDTEQLKEAAQEAVEVPGPKDATRIAWIGRLVEVKRLDILLEAVNLLTRTANQTWRFYIFGDGPLASRFKAVARQLGISESVFFMGFTTKIVAYLRAMDVLVITSDHEGLPMTVLEALALEVPIIAHAVGGIPSVLGQGDYGTLIYEQTPAAYAEAIGQITRAREESLAKARAGRAVVEEDYSARRQALEYRRLYWDMAR